MSNVFISILPLAIASSLSVTSLPLFFAILISNEKQLKNGFAFILGGILALTIIAILIVLPLSVIDSGVLHHDILHAILDFGLALFCMILGLITWLKKGKSKAPTDAKKHSGAVKYFVYGMVIRLLSVNTLPPYIGSIKEITGLNLSLADEIILSSLVIFISMLTIILPFVVYIFNRETAKKLLNPLSNFLLKNKKTINISLLFLVSVYLCYQGFTRLQ